MLRSASRSFVLAALRALHLDPLLNNGNGRPGSRKGDLCRQPHRHGRCNHRKNPRFLGRHTADEARAHYETFIAPYFTTDGQADLNIGATAITTVTAELGVPATVTAAEFYRTATTTP